jgi:transposase InsO family protein
METDKNWLDGPEFSELAGLDRSVASRQLKAAHEEGKRWRGTILKVRKVPGRGRGGFKYQVAARSLPENLFQEYCRRKSAAIAPQGDIERDAAVDAACESTTQKSDAQRKDKATAQFSQLPPHKQERAWARFDVLQACDRYIRANNLARCRGEEVFANEYSRGRFEVSERAREFVQGVKVRTLRNWIAAEREYGLFGLVDSRGAHNGKSKLDAHPEVQQFIIGLILEKTILRPGFVYEAIESKYPDITKQFSSKTVERFITRWRKENDQIYCRLTHPDRWKSEYKMAIGSQSEAITALNQLWSLDDTRADLLLTDGRYSAIFLIDIYSRRVIIRIAKNADAIGVGTLLRSAMLAWGTPQAILIDNGKPYSNAHINGALSSFEIKLKTCTPYASEEKGIVERVQGTFSKMLEMCPGFIGHSVSDRKRIEAKRSFAQRSSDPHETFEVKISAIELQEFANRWCEDRYQHTPHSGLPINPDTRQHFTPFEMATAWRGQVRKIDERALDILLLMKGESRSVTKKGIQIDRARYWHPDLVRYIGKQVIVRLDPEDLGKAIVHSADAHIFTCIAENIERSGLSLKEVAAVATVAQKKFLKEETEQYRAARKAIRREHPVMYVMRRDREAVAKVAAFPHRQIPHSTPGIEAAIEGAEALQEAKAEKKKVERQPVKVLEPDVPAISLTSLKMRICRVLNRPITADEALRLERKYSQGVREDQVETIARQLDAIQLVSEPDQPISAEANAKE